MNDKDKEAFGIFMGQEFKKCPTESCGREYLLWGEEFEKYWQAACEYKNQEYANIMDAMTRTSQNNAELKKEIDAIKSENLLCERVITQIQASKFEMREEIEKLQAENDDLHEIICNALAEYKKEG